jgi:uncharacterized protein
MIFRALGLLAALVFSPLSLAAQSLPEPRSDTVSDFANVLDSAAEGRIVRLLLDQREATGVQMMVVTMPSIEAYGAASGQRLDAYAKALFNAWGVGGQDRNDGILMLVVTDAREVRIALGAGYDAVYDGRAARVLSTAVLPEFREGRVAEGIEAGILSTRDRIIAPFQEGRPVTLTEGFEPEGDGASSTPWLLGAGGLVGAIGFLIWRGARKARTCPKCGQLTLTRRREVIEPATASASGTGLLHMLCESCGHSERHTYSISRSNRDRDGRGGSGPGSSPGGSGGRGFGGGKSSGGGAGGKW